MYSWLLFGGICSNIFKYIYLRHQNFHDHTSKGGQKWDTFQILFSNGRICFKELCLRSVDHCGIHHDREFWNSEEKELSVSRRRVSALVVLSLDLIRRGSDDLASRATTMTNS